MQPLHVLVVDPDSLRASQTVRLLESFAARATRVAGVGAARRHMLFQSIDLALVSESLGGLGHELLRELSDEPSVHAACIGSDTSGPSVQLLGDLLVKARRLGRAGPRASTEALLEHSERLLGLVDPPVGLVAMGRAAVHDELEVLHRGSGHFGELLSALWSNTKETADLALRMGRFLDVPEREELYLGALFHNLGEALLLRSAQELGWLPTTLHVRRLEGLARREHERLGRRLLIKWGAPTELTSLAAAHHSPPMWRETPEQARRRRIVLMAWSTAVARGHGYWPSHFSDDGRCAAAAAVGSLGWELGISLDELGAGEPSAHSALRRTGER